VSATTGWFARISSASCSICPGLAAYRSFIVHPPAASGRFAQKTSIRSPSGSKTKKA
jgi:hypothetical protein